MTLEELGQQIKQAREEKGVGLDEIAQKIKLSVPILTAIEKGDGSGLPHAVYTKGFTKSYAANVGLDSDEFRDEIDKAFAPSLAEDAQTDHSLNNKYKQQNTGKSFAFYMVLLLLLGGLGAGLWYVGANYGPSLWSVLKTNFSSMSSQSVEVIPPAPTNPATPDATRAETAQAQPAEPQDTPAEPSQEDIIPGLDATNTTGQTPEEQAENTGFLLISPETAGKHVVSITAKDECYLAITRDNGNPVYHLIKNGEEYLVRFDNRLRLTVGNAAGISIKYNGNDMGELGRKGQKRDFTFPPREQDSRNR